MQKLNIPSGEESLSAELYEADNPKNKEAITLMLQGAGALGGMWRKKAKEYAQNGISTLIGEYRGFGESDGEKDDVNFMKHREDTKAMLDFAEQELGFAVRNVIGHCYGGSHAIANAENINGKMVLATPFINALSFITMNKKITARYALPALVDSLGLKTHINLSDKKGLYRDPSAEIYNQLARDLNLEKWSNRLLARELLRCPLNYPASKKQIEALKEKSQNGDLLIVNPMDDPIINPKMTKKFAEKIGAERYDKPTGHFGIYDDEDTFNKISNFLKSDKNNYDAKRIMRGGSIF